MKKVTITVSGSPADLINTFCRRYTEEVFPVNYIYTLGYDICRKNVLIGQLKIEQNIIHVSDKHEFKPIRRDLFMSSEGSIIVFDNSNPEYYLSSKEIIQEVRELNTEPIILLAVVRDTGEVLSDESVSYAKRNSISYKKILINDDGSFNDLVMNFTKQILGIEESKRI
ncbi:MAG: hypothetical protein ACTSR2_06920 [Candidatus Hodarchaeales archaeon]